MAVWPLSGWRRVPSPNETKSSLSNPDFALLELFAALPAASGVVVTPANAMTCAPVRAAVETICEAVGQLPLHLYARASDGTKTRATSHAVHRLLHDEASEWQSAADFREQLTRDALLHGNGFAFVVRVDGRPFEMIRLDPSAMTITVGDDGGPEYSSRERDGTPITYDRRDIFHVRAPSLNGVSGASPVREGREAIGLALQLEQHAARLFGRGGRPSGVLSFPKSLGSETSSRISASWHTAHAGEASGKTAVLEEGGTFQQLALNSVDSQFLELRRFAVEEIARIYRVAPIFVGDYGRATWANSESMRRDFIDFTLRRWLSQFESEVRLKLLTPGERETYFAEFLLDDFVKGDLATRTAAYAQQIASRILSPNEARAAENRAGYLGGDKFENPNTTAVAA